MGDWWEAVLDGGPLDPLQATFQDGVRANELGDALLQAAAEGRRIELAARS
jgi:predicted dehydrogenase